MFDFISNGWDFVGVSFGVTIIVLAIGVAVSIGRSQDKGKP